MKKLAPPRATTPEADTFQSSKPKPPATTATPDKTPLILSGLSFVTSLLAAAGIGYIAFFKEPAKATDSVETAVKAVVEPLQEELKTLINGLNNPTKSDIANEVLLKIQGKLDNLQASMSSLPNETLVAFQTELQQLKTDISNIKTVDNTALAEQLSQIQNRLEVLVSEKKVKLEIGEFLANTPEAVIAQTMIDRTTPAYTLGKKQLDLLLGEASSDKLVQTGEIHSFLKSLSDDQQRNPALLLEVAKMLQTRRDSIGETVALLSSINESKGTTLFHQTQIIQNQLNSIFWILTEYLTTGNLEATSHLPKLIETDSALAFLKPALEKMKKSESIENETSDIFKFLTNQVQKLKEAEDGAIKLIKDRKKQIADSPYPFDLASNAKPTTPQALFDLMPASNNQRIIVSYRKFLQSLNIKAITDTSNELKYDITNPKYLTQELHILGLDYYQIPIEKLEEKFPADDITPLKAFKNSAKLLEACLPFIAREDKRRNAPLVEFKALPMLDAQTALETFKKIHPDKPEVITIAQAFIDANNLPQNSAEEIEAYSKAMKQATKKAFEYLHEEYNKLPNLRDSLLHS